MSTASQHCGTVCSACGGRLHAPSAPGVSGTTRGHYDPRARAKAGGQLGSPGHAPQKDVAEVHVGSRNRGAPELWLLVLILPFPAMAKSQTPALPSIS
jgi:hypothetical protein